MLLQANLLISYWGDTVHYAVQVLNTMPWTGQMKSPLKIVFCKIPDYDKLHVFRCLAFRHKQSKSSFEEKSEKCLFLGLRGGKFKLKSLQTNTIFETIDATFNNKEYDALITLNTWELILKSSIPPNTTVHNLVWKMKIKDNG